MNICWVEAVAPVAARRSADRWAWQCYSCRETAGRFTGQAAAQLGAADHCWAVASASLTAGGYSPIPQWREIVTDPVLQGCDLGLVALLLTVAGFYVPHERITPMSATELRALAGCYARDAAGAARPDPRRRTSLTVAMALEDAGLEIAVWRDAARVPADEELPALAAALHHAGLLASLNQPRLGGVTSA